MPGFWSDNDVVHYSPQRLSMMEMSLPTDEGIPISIMERGRPIPKGDYKEFKNSEEHWQMLEEQMMDEEDTPPRKPASELHSSGEHTVNLLIDIAVPDRNDQYPRRSHVLGGLENDGAFIDHSSRQRRKSLASFPTGDFTYHHELHTETMEQLSRVNKENETLKNQIVQLQKDLSDAQDFIFSLQPRQINITESEAVSEYNSLCGMVQQWVDTNVGDALYERQMHREKLYLLHSAKDLLDLVSKPGKEAFVYLDTDEYNIVSAIMKFLCTEIFDRPFYCPIEDGAVKILSSVEKAMRNMEPRRDLSAIRSWRSETYTAVCQRPDFSEFRRARTMQLTDQLTGMMSVIVPRAEKRKLHVSIQNNIIKPAMALAHRLHLSVDRFSLEWTAFSRIPPESRSHSPKDFAEFECLNITQGARVIRFPLPNPRCTLTYILDMAPSLVFYEAKADAWGEAKTLKKARVLVALMKEGDEPYMPPRLNPSEYATCLGQLEDKNRESQNCLKRRYANLGKKARFWTVTYSRARKEDRQPKMEARNRNVDRSRGSSSGYPHNGYQQSRPRNSKESPRSFALPGMPPAMYKEWEESSTDYKWEETKPKLPVKAESPRSEKKSATASYLDAEVPVFGLQYGISRLSLREKVNTDTVVTRGSELSPSENISPNVKGDMERAFLMSLHCTDDADKTVIGLKGGNRSSIQASIFSDEVVSTPTTQATECMICVEPFSSTVIRPKLISIACLHEPSVCTNCMAISIKSELASKMWNQIKCPECQTSLINDDIQRLADPETYGRYEALSFRSLISADKNFVWCTQCPFGQLHASGNKQPIMRCLKCGHRSCFRHSVPWHERLTCEEYDALLKDPENFASAGGKEDLSVAKIMKMQEENNERLLIEEVTRQKQVNAVERQKARRRQQEEAERKREEIERQKKLDVDRLKMIEDIKRRQMEDELSLKMVQATTKQCPSCQWPIEKNEGCAHMTCIKCRAEFCWACLSDYEPIRQYGNDRHERSCEYHSDNLPSYHE
ncbi:hypothetical protein B7463_g2071, partial [Scytalidium lignicola]